VSEKPRGGSSRHKVVTREMEIVNQYGLHARPAALLVKTASRFESDVSIEKDGSRVSGKSIMGLMTLEAGLGVKLKVTAEGPDAEEAIQELQQLIDNKFYEE
jgi:phosphocarrier protein HPr